jgi:hypothetical protein
LEYPRQLHTQTVPGINHSYEFQISRTYSLTYIQSRPLDAMIYFYFYFLYQPIEGRGRETRQGKQSSHFFPIRQAERASEIELWIIKAPLTQSKPPTIKKTNYPLREFLVENIFFNLPISYYIYLILLSYTFVVSTTTPHNSIIQSLKGRTYLG